MKRRVVAQEELCVLPALPDPLVAEGVPGPRLLNDVRFRGEIDEQRRVADPLVEQDVELGLLNGGATLFLTTLTRTRCRSPLALLDRPDTADVEPDDA